jgi:two-component system, OmpR family, response regulator
MICTVEMPGEIPAQMEDQRPAMVTRVLVIEDDTETAEEIVAELSSNGFQVDWVATGSEGLIRASSGDYDAMTVDRMLPDVDGLTIVENIRNNGIKTPVLVVSALGEVGDRVRGLKTGGDDYLVKPFALVELSARLEALLRRPADQREPILRVGPLTLDLIERTAQRNNRELDMLPREFRVLEYLMRHAGKTVTRAMLFEEVWHYRFDPRTNLVDVHIGRLRRKVDAAGETPMIQSIRGIGFLLRAPT